MRCKLPILFVLVSAATWTSSSALAQRPPKPSDEPRSLVDHLDRLRQKILGGVLPPGSQPRPNPPAPGPQTQQFGNSRISIRPMPARSGSAMGVNSQQGTPGSTPGQSPTNGWSTAPGSPGFHSAVPPSRQALQPTAAPPVPTDPGVSGSRRLHQRLMAFRESPFGETGGSQLPATDHPAAQLQQPTATGLPVTPPPSAPSAGPSQGASVPRRAESPTLAGRRPTGSSPEASYPAGGHSAGGRSAARQVPPPADMGSDLSQLGRSDGPGGDGNVLFTRQSPILGVETIGPRRIAVGREAVYGVTIRNSGQVAADQVVVSVDLPKWADVLATEPSAGTAGAVMPEGEGGQLRWTIGRLEAKGQEKLVLKIVPRESRPFDLAVKWDYTPVASQAAIEVQEPKLEMRLEGPREVLFGAQEVYRLEVSNSGTGDVEGLVVSLLPMGPEENLPASHQFGTLLAGETKVIEVELTARQAETLTIKVDAFGSDGVEAHLLEKITVRRATLNVAVEGPEVQYVGTEARYRIRVSNSGNATAENLTVTATIPPEADFVSSGHNSQVDPNRAKVTWKLASLAPGADKTFALACNLRKTGASRLEILSTAEGGLTSNASAVTRVDAIADLELEVRDPAGPVPVGTETTYEVEVHNRGTKGAEGVEVVAYFSHGVEPTAVEGGRHQIGSGQVVFEKIPTLAAGKTVVFKIKAQADTPGNHLFRVEVYCTPLGTRLVS